MKTLSCILLLVQCVYFSLAQMQTVPINTVYNHQVAPSIANSPQYNWVLCANWNRYDPAVPPSTPAAYRVGWAVSIDNGNSWGIYNYFPFESIDPCVRFDRHGPSQTSIHSAFASVQNLSYGAIYHTIMQDFGQYEWEQLVRVSNATMYQRNPKMAIDNYPQSSYEGRVYLTWSDEWRRILLKYSSDRGATWSSEVVITASGNSEGPSIAGYYLGNENGVPGEEEVGGDPPSSVRFPDVIVAPNGDVYVAWYEFEPGVGGRIPIRRSSDGGDSFEDQVIAADGLELGVCWIGNARPYMRPSLAGSPNGTLFVTTCDRKPNDPDPYLRLFRSDDQGNSWEQIWSRLSPYGQQDFFPQVVVTPDGRVNITFMHSNASVTCAYDETNSAAAWVVTSYDNGTTFGTPRQVSNSFSLNSGLIPYSDAAAAAGYTDDAVFAVWTDHRNSHPAPYFANINTPPAPPHNMQMSIQIGQWGYRHPRIT
jgi:hypothetical protein